MKIWERKFKDFKSAERHKKGKGFSSVKWLKSQKNDLESCQKSFKKNTKLPSKYTMRYNQFLYLIKKLFLNKSKIEILDFGGGFGAGYFYLIINLKKKNFSYTILEIPSLVKNLKKNKIPIKYISKISKKKYDIINCCSVMQYIDCWKTTIDKICKLNCKYIFFSDMFVGNIKTFCTLQNYYESKIPHWFLDFTEFNNKLNEKNYKLISKKKMITKRLNSKTVIQMNNFKKKDRIPYTLNLLYKKIKS